MTRATRLALAATFGRFPHGPLHIPRRLPDGRVQVGCDQCGATDTVADEAAARLFLAGHRAGARLVREVRADG